MRNTTASEVSEGYGKIAAEAERDVLWCVVGMLS
jgi:hypothetical protein